MNQVKYDIIKNTLDSDCAKDKAGQDSDECENILFHFKGNENLIDERQCWLCKKNESLAVTLMGELQMGEK